MAKNQPKAKASTQEHLDLADITEDLVILKNGWVAMILTSTAVNFDLLSEAEQDATIYAYGALLNSLTFPVQILIRSKKADITSYFQSLEEAENTQANPDLRRQIQKYKEFIQTTVQQKTVLDKKFYLVISFSPLGLGLKSLTSRSPAKSKSKAQLIEDAKIALVPKRDHLIKQMARLGLAARQLTTQEIIELFYDIYNPAPTGTQRVLLDTASYTTPLIQPAVEIPTPAPTPPVGGVNSSTVPSQNPDFKPAPPSNSQQPASAQAKTLKELQEATARAAQILNNQQIANSQTSPNQPIADPADLRPVPPNPERPEPTGQQAAVPEPSTQATNPNPGITNEGDRT